MNLHPQPTPPKGGEVLMEKLGIAVLTAVIGYLTTVITKKK